MKDINVLTVNSITGNVTFDFRDGNEIVSGRDALIQRATLYLLNDAGSSAFDPNVGSSISDIIGGSYAEGEHDVVKTLITLGVEEIEQKMLGEQSGVNFAEDELDTKLKSIEIIEINFNETSVAWNVKILVRTAANNIGIIGL